MARPHLPAVALALAAVFAAESRQAAGQTARESSESSLTLDTLTEAAAYADSNDVFVYTPSVSGTLSNPLAGWSASGGYLIDIISAASVDIVSTASPAWDEIRHAGHLSAGYKPGDFGGTVFGSVSTEPDYLSLSVGGNLSLDLRDKTITPLIGYTYAHDTAGRTGTPFSVFSLELDRHTLSAAVSLVAGPSTTLTFSGDAILESGRQEKPYRFVPMFEPSVAPEIPAGASVDQVNRQRLPGRFFEQVPESRNRFAVSGRLSHRFRAATLTLWERAYADDWGVLASTTDGRLVFEIADRLSLWPHLRAHVQSGASFWQRAYTATIANEGTIELPLLRTGDRELSPLQIWLVGPGARWDIGPGVRPELYSLVFQVDGSLTHYTDALFITDRTSIFGTVQFEAEF